MERVWKEISLISSLEDDQEAPGEEEQGEREMRLQDFLAGERRSRCSGVSSEIVGMSRSRTAAAEGSAAAATSVLSLNSGCNDQMRDLDWLGGFEPTKVSSSSSSSLHHHPQHSMVEGFGSFCRKRGVVLNGEDFVDRRQKRMIKNRESAARSRARKQASHLSLSLSLSLSHFFPVSALGIHQRVGDRNRSLGGREHQAEATTESTTANGTTAYDRDDESIHKGEADS